MSAANTDEMSFEEPIIEDVEILDEITEATAARGVGESRTIASLVLGRVDEMAQELANLVRASIVMTNPQDWVVYTTRDGHKLAYLQDVGCQRVAPLWGISTRVTDTEKTTEGDHFHCSVMVTGHCKQTGQDFDEIGSRSSSGGLFEMAWKKTDGDPQARVKLRFDVQKSAIANARGRAIRNATGLNLVPLDVLEGIFGTERAKLCRGVRHESGTKGGSGDMASEPQLKRLAMLATKQKLVNDAPEYHELMKILEGCALKKKGPGSVSEVMQRLEDASKPASWAAFCKAIGFKDTATPKGEEAPQS